MIDQPGIYSLPEADYHADTALAPSLGPSLSVSGAKTLRTNPARFAWEREHGRANKTVFDDGTVAHALILGNPDERVRVIDAYDWRTKAAQEAKKDAYAMGLVPIHRGKLRDLIPLRRAVRRHRLSSAILSKGQPEQSMYWIDPATGITCRGRIDWAREDALADVKTVPAGGTDDDALAKMAANFDWPMQAAHYTDGWEQITGEALPFLFIAVEKDAPHFVRVVQLDDDTIQTGRERMAEARELFALYEKEGYPIDNNNIDIITAPRWYAA